MQFDPNIITLLFREIKAGLVHKVSEDLQENGVILVHLVHKALSVLEDSK